MDYNPDLEKIEKNYQAAITNTRERYIEELTFRAYWNCLEKEAGWYLEGENKDLLWNYVGHLARINNHDDSEIGDYELAFVSSYLYDCFILNTEKMSEFIRRRWEQFKIILSENNNDWNKSLEAETELLKLYQTPDEMVELLAPSFEEKTTTLILHAYSIIKDYAHLFVDPENELEYEFFQVSIPDIFSVFDSEFMDFFTDYSKNIILEFETQSDDEEPVLKITFSVPNLIADCRELYFARKSFVEDQENEVIEVEEPSLIVENI